MWPEAWRRDVDGALGVPRPFGHLKLVIGHWIQFAHEFLVTNLV